GIRVVRVWTYMAPNTGVCRRIVDYLSFMVMSAIAAPFLPRPDVIVGTSPQFFTLISAWWASVVKRRPWVLELRDIWPESIKAVGAGGHSVLFRAVQRVEMLLYRKATRIVTVTHSFKRVLTDRGVPADKIAVVTNGVDLTRYKPGEKNAELLRTFELEGRFVVGYIGTHGMAHGLDTLLDAAEIMSRQQNLQHVAMLFVGDGAKRVELIAFARQKGLDNVRFVGPVSKEEVATYWSILDLSIIHLRRTELFTTTIPSKLFECMGMGIPVALGIAGEAREIVEHHDVGLTFLPEDAGELVAVIERLAQDHRLVERLRANSAAAAPNFNRENLADAMLRELGVAAEQSRS
ncbi:MAG: glycosyltransferase family 4 protein, partial [Pyrinomonadaceae bacterium]|nr:glycosyltransferase family 4 protein [Pyrinomonadaceae bacterium]